MKNSIRLQPPAWGSVNLISRIFFLVLWGWVLGTLPLSAHEALENAQGSTASAEDREKDLLRLGSTVYKHMCVFCHGENGDGGGKAMVYLYPWPRDFRQGVFKYRTTPFGSIPLDEDIARTISRGVPGTSMPAWGDALSGDEIKGVVKYIKRFSERFIEEKAKAGITIGAAPASTLESVEKGKKVYQEMGCAQCHGTDLQGDGAIADDLYDIWDHRIFIYDLTDPNTYKFGFDKKDLYLILTAGIDGTPMKSYNHLTDEERWNLASYIDSKIRKEEFKPAQYETDLSTYRVEQEIDVDPDNPVWDNVPVHNIHTIPLNARRDPIDQIQFQSVVNDEGIAFRLEWEDSQADRTSSRHQDFKDAIAMEFALGEVLLHKHGHNEPFFGMGNRGKVVNIWQWRADWQTEIETKEKLEYATKGIDLDTMIFGGEVNPVDALNPFRDVPVEELNAEGFGTLTPQPQTKQNVQGKGVWKEGKWSVVFFRTLDSLNKWDIKFKSKNPVLVAFAIWDGKHQDRNGRKVISMWQRLKALELP
jgi:mono/diheme cytochrome c family protein